MLISCIISFTLTHRSQSFNTTLSSQVISQKKKPYTKLHNRKTKIKCSDRLVSGTLAFLEYLLIHSIRLATRLTGRVLTMSTTACWINCPLTKNKNNNYFVTIVKHAVCSVYCTAINSIHHQYSRTSRKRPSKMSSLGGRLRKVATNESLDHTGSKFCLISIW